MTTTKTTKPAAAAQGSDPATVHQNILKRQRERMHRALLKRRRRKSNQ